jgi:hypothetical protein
MPHLGVIFSGILTIGSSFLTVDEGWERYLGNVEQTWKRGDDFWPRQLD